MSANFSFEASEQYKTFAGRRNKQLYYAAVVYSGLIIFAIILSIIMDRKDPWVGLAGSVGLFVLIGIYGTIASILRVRNYITRLVYEDGRVTIDYAHADTITRYSGRLDEFEIEKKKSLWGGSKYKASYFLRIKSLNDYSVIKQNETLDWNVKLMDDFMTAINEPSQTNS